MQYQIPKGLFDILPYSKDLWKVSSNWQYIESIIRKEFTLKNPLSAYSSSLEQQIQKETSVSLHVRRGEMASVKKVNEWHGTCSIEYYNEAVQKMAGFVKNPHFFIFSDDPVWVKKHITPPFPTTYVVEIGRAHV